MRLLLDVMKSCFRQFYSKVSVNADVFYAWVEQALLAELPENSVIVMDNATFHKRSDIREILKKAGHDILWLPPYDPDLNPMEV